MNETPITNRTLFQDEHETPLGQLRIAAYIKDNPGVPLRSMRVLGRYAVVYIVEGGGVYVDANGVRCDVTAGDLLILFPELAHGYGPRPGGLWSEIYVIFDGPAFDSLRAGGLLDPAVPVHHAEPVAAWRRRLEWAVQPMPMAPLPAKVAQLGRFLQTLTEMLAPPTAPASAPEPPWLEGAKYALGSDLGEPLSLDGLAERCGLSYETFRKQFKEHTATSPARYRLNRRLDAVSSLLRFTPMTLSAIAESLGFSDEFHLSNRFKQRFGVSPTEYRKRERV